MGIEISRLADQHNILVNLICDAEGCGWNEYFTRLDGYVGVHNAVMSMGWLERNGPQGRLWLCPRCSGKK